MLHKREDLHPFLPMDKCFPVHPKLTMSSVLKFDVEYCQAVLQLASTVPVELRLALSLIITTPTNPTGKVEMQFEINKINK